MLIPKFYKSILSNGGATVSFTTKELNPDTGIFSSLKGLDQTIPLAEFTPDKATKLIQAYIKKNQNLLKTKGYFLGAWVYNEEVYLDISRKFDSEPEALEFARANEQKAIYNAETKQVTLI